jgi:hypothetical protein
MAVEIGIRRVVLVPGRQTARRHAAEGATRVPVRDLRDYEGLARALAAALGADVEIRRGSAAPRALLEADALVVCPWTVGVRWFDRGRACGDGRRCLVVDGDEEWLVERAGRWNLAAGVSSGALSRWQRPVAFAFPLIVGRIAVAERMGADMGPLERWHDGYASFSHGEERELVGLLCRYLACL